MWTYSLTIVNAAYPISVMKGLPTLLISDFENLFRGLGQAATTATLSGVEVVMSMEEIPGGMGPVGMAGAGGLSPGGIGAAAAVAAAAAAAGNVSAGAAGGAGAAGVNPTGPAPGMPDGAGISHQPLFGADIFTFYYFC